MVANFQLSCIHQLSLLARRHAPLLAVWQSTGLIGLNRRQEDSASVRTRINIRIEKSTDMFENGPERIHSTAKLLSPNINIKMIFKQRLPAGA